MKNKLQTLATSLLGVAIAMLMTVSGSVLAQTHNTVQQVPKFRAEGSWAKMPSQWVMSLVASTWVDDQNHLWVLQRPRALSVPKKCRPFAAWR